MNRSSLGYTGVLALCLLAVQPSTSHAVNAFADDPRTPCVKWNVSFDNANLRGRPFVLTQSNGYRVVLFLEQNGQQITGDASWSSTTPPKAFSGSFGTAIEGDPVSGTLRGNALTLTTKSGGRYLGEIDNTGHLTGITHDPRTRLRATWTAQGLAECLLRQADVRPVPVPSTPVSPADPGNDAGQRGSRAGGALRAALGVAGPAPRPATQVSATASAPSVYCKPGFVWRVARPSDLVCVTVASRTRVAEENRTAASRVERRERGRVYGPNQCAVGYVWREAFDGDVVCVTPAIRQLVREENRLGPGRRIGA